MLSFSTLFHFAQIGGFVGLKFKQNELGKSQIERDKSKSLFCELHPLPFKQIGYLSDQKKKNLTIMWGLQEEGA